MPDTATPFKWDAALARRARQMRARRPRWANLPELAYAMTFKASAPATPDAETARTP